MKAFMNWSGGKDSALALYHAERNGLKAACLSTHVNAVHQRISMHGVRRSLLEDQALAIGLPLVTLELPEQPDMRIYEEKMKAHLSRLQEEHYTTAIFGDIFLEDLRKYREEQLMPFGINCEFPLWKRDTRDLIKKFIALGFKAIIVCVNASLLDQSFCGRLIDEDFINDLPTGVDVCGENGEYHSFVFDGPIFSQPVAFSKGEIVKRSYPSPKDSRDDCFTSPSSQIDFYFCELCPFPYDPK
jgi:uncharacterized protein (TIGR00290 family)